MVYLGIQEVDPWPDTSGWCFSHVQLQLQSRRRTFAVELKPSPTGGEASHRLCYILNRVNSLTLISCHGSCRRCNCLKLMFEFETPLFQQAYVTIAISQEPPNHLHALTELCLWLIDRVVPVDRPSWKTLWPSSPCIHSSVTCYYPWTACGLDGA